MARAAPRWLQNGGGVPITVEETAQLEGLLRESGHDGLDKLQDGDRALASVFAQMIAEFREEALAPLAESGQRALRALYPQELRPVPAFTVLQFRPRKGVLVEPRNLPRGTAVTCRPDGMPVTRSMEGAAIRLTTTAPVEVAPLELAGQRRTRHGRGSGIELEFRSFEAGSPVTAVLPPRLRLFARHPHLEGALALRAALLDPRMTVTIELADRSGTKVTRERGGAGVLHAVGLDTRSQRGADGVSTDVLPWPRRADEGVRLLFEFVNFPLKFAFIDLDTAPFGFDGSEPADGVATIRIRLDAVGDLPDGELAPFCTPAVNLFPCQARPMRPDDSRTDHLLTPEAPSGQEREVFSVDEVRSLAPGGAVIPAFDFAAVEGPHYDLIRQRTPGGTRSLLRIFGQAQLSGSGVAASLTCTDRWRPGVPMPNDLVGEGPPQVFVVSIAPMSSPLPARDREDSCWRLLSLLGGERDGRLSVEQLRRELEFVLPTEGHRAQDLADGLHSLSVTWSDQVARRSWVRTCDVRIEVDGSSCSGPGEFALWADVLAAWVRSVAPVNSETSAQVEDPRRGWRRNTATGERSVADPT